MKLFDTKEERVLQGKEDRAARRQGNSTYARLLRAKDEVYTIKLLQYSAAMNGWHQKHPGYKADYDAILKQHGFQNQTEYSAAWNLTAPQKEGSAPLSPAELLSVTEAHAAHEASKGLRDKYDPLYMTVVRGYLLVRDVLVYSQDHPDDEQCYEVGVAAMRLLNEYATRFIMENQASNEHEQSGPS